MVKKPDDGTYDVLLNTRRDSTVLMTFWYIHKSFWAFLLGGLLIALILGQTRDDLFDLRNTRDLSSLAVSPLIGLLVALLCKLVADKLFTLTAYPLLQMRKQRVTNQPGNILFRFFDLWRDMRGISTLRWTHAVRQQAMQQFETGFFRSDKINNTIDLITILLLVLCIVLLLA